MRIKVEGTGFPTYPANPPKVFIGGGEDASPVAVCEVIPYLSTETVLICEAGPASTFTDSYGERNRVNGRYSTHALRVVPGVGREATCTGASYHGVPCGVLLHNEKVPALTAFSNPEVADFRSVASGDLLKYNGDRLRNAHQNTDGGNPYGHEAKDAAPDELAQTFLAVGLHSAEVPRGPHG